MIELRISEERIADITLAERDIAKTMIREYGIDAGINHEFRYRWITISEENYLLARLKYGVISELFGAYDATNQ